jgi:hypothetical protein
VEVMFGVGWWGQGTVQAVMAPGLQQYLSWHKCKALVLSRWGISGDI